MTYDPKPVAGRYQTDLADLHAILRGSTTVRTGAKWPRLVKRGVRPAELLRQVDDILSGMKEMRLRRA